MTRQTIASIVCLSLWAAGAPTVDAQARPVEQTSDFWREVRDPGYAQARQWLAQGRRFQVRSAETTTPARRAAFLRSAILRFEAGLRLQPEDPELLFQLARTQTVFERPNPETGGVERMDDEAIAGFERLRELHPAHRTEQVAFDLGILYSRVGRDDLAIEAYEDSIRAALSIPETATTYSNLAETRMITGDLLGAVRDYERSIEIARSTSNLDPRSLALPLWGLAVALERLGEHRTALERARDALSVGGGTLDVLRSEGVFFEPAAEIHFYEGLGHLALADAALEPAVIATHRAHAHASWRAYVRLAEADDPWRELAAEYVQQTAPE